MPHYTFPKRAIRPIAFCVAFAIGYNIIPSPAPADPPYMVPARQGTDASLSCVSGALASLQRTRLNDYTLVPVVNAGGIEGVIVLLPGSGIPDPATVEVRGNVRIESILYACGTHIA